MDLSGSGSEGDGSNDSNATECFSLATAPSGVLHYHAIMLTAIALISIIGNVLVLVLFAKFQELRTRSVVVSMSMVVADLLFTLAYTFQVIVTTANAGWAFGDVGCTLFGFMASDLLITRWLVVSLLCLDRFLYVRFPFSYQRRGKCVLITFITLAWVVPIVTSLVPLGFVNFKLRESQPVCLPNCIGKSLACRAYYFLVFTTLYILGSIVPIVLYSWLYCKARTLRRSTNHTLGRLTIQIAGGILVSQPVGEQNNVSKREGQATITFVLIIATVVITGTPGYILQILRSVFSDLQCQIPIIVHFIIIEFFLCAPMLTPLVIMRDAAFRKSLLKLCCCRRRQTEDLQLGIRSLGDSRFFSGIYSRRSSVVTTVPHPSQESTTNTNDGGDTRTRSNSIAVKPAVYTISESCESLPPHTPSPTIGTPT